MKAACVILSIIVVVAIVAIICMVKFATEITVEDRKLEHVNPSTGTYQYSKLLGVISLNDQHSVSASNRFPYVAAIMKNDSATWSFSCFASIILQKWLVTAAHCRRLGYTHRVLLYYDFARNFTHTYPVLLWRLHEKFSVNNTSPKYDIAVAKLNMDLYPYSPRPAFFDERPAQAIEASIWKTVTTMDSRMYLTNDFAKFDMKIVQPAKCFESYGVEIDDSMICVDMSTNDDCFATEFGPVFSSDRLIGVLAVKPRDCDNKLAIFTNISYYYSWILRTTHSALAG